MTQANNQQLKNLYDWYFVAADMAGLIPPSFDEWRNNEKAVATAQQSAESQNYNWLNA